MSRYTTKQTGKDFDPDTRFIVHDTQFDDNVREFDNELDAETLANRLNERDEENNEELSQSEQHASIQHENEYL